MESEFEYYRRRAAEEQEAALRAQTAKAEQCHRVLAERYALKAEQLAEAAAA